MPRLGRYRSAIACVLAAMHLACLTPRHAVDTRDYVEAAGVGHVRVTRTDGTVLELYSPRVLMDTMFTGWTANGTKFVGIPLSQVQSVTARRASEVRTALLAGAAAGVILAAILLFGTSNVSVADTVEEDFTRQPRP